ncbi:polysaccharide biosynthesis tyrosine autokinase [candidate division KSB1 bacterium]|nr:polysaccharide biosynthesis tyrosine autokinase [candidate division KSB1 bacterium]NIR69181.1 polysaccharide biosynthesis tyrosine autokinase [candidate division KSB1 bacterium]NIS25692.1 polysaccharide biosynthesis tyrosine autokinase [candidate division KSB1 bacterium]NIT72560.1 polysaccharide biosynthesis tyrosine autokinase [candidate division KSB1 bacterium]NIU26369.1 polysaccharide biosynthesis tyrosine autokinase [candidate division KSB1 bacterium]
MENSTGMTNSSNRSISFLDFLGMIRRKWWLMVICAIGMLGPITIYNQNAPPVFEASTQLIFEDSEKLMGSQMALSSKDKESFILNQIKEMKTESFAKEVYQSLPIEMRNRFVAERPTSSDLTPERYATKKISNNLSVEPTRGTEVVEIRFEAKDPDLAQTVTTTAADALIRRNLELRRKKYSSVKAFVERQFEVVKNRLREAEQALEQFKEKNQITSLETQTREILQRMSEAEILYNQVVSENKEIQEKVTALRSKLDSEKRDLSRTILRTTNPFVVRLRERLVELEVQYSNLLVQGIPSGNPKMQEIQNEISQIRENLVQETLKINEDDNLANLLDPFSQMRKIAEQLIGLEAELQAQAAKEENLRALLANYENRLKQLPEKEMTLARLTRDVESQNRMYMQLLQERETARLNEAAEIGNIRIIEPAIRPTEPIRPRTLLNLVVGVISSLIIGSLLVVGIEHFNNKIKSEDEVVQALGLPVISAIPRLKHDFSLLFHPERNGNLVESNRNEAFMGDEFNLLYFALMKKIKTPCAIMITSSIPNEGKSTIAALLAFTSAQRGRKTLLIDADLRKPGLHSIFHISKTPGLTNLAVDFMRTVRCNGYANGSSDIIREPIMRKSLRKSIMQTFEKKLLFLPAGFIPANPMKAWSAKIWQSLFSQLKRIADVIIIDAPPIIGIPDAAILSSHVDHILYCIQSGAVDRLTLRRSFGMFRNAVKDSNDKIVGAILNKVDVSSQYGKYKYYRYYAKNYTPRAMKLSTLNYEKMKVIA